MAISIPVISLLVLSATMMVIALRRFKSNRTSNLLTNETELAQRNGPNRRAVFPTPTRPCPIQPRSCSTQPRSCPIQPRSCPIQPRPSVPPQHILTTKVPYYDLSSIIITGH